MAAALLVLLAPELAVLVEDIHVELHDRCLSCCPKMARCRAWADKQGSRCLRGMLQVQPAQRRDIWCRCCKLVLP